MRADSQHEMKKLKTYHNVHEWAVDDVRRWLVEKGFDASIGELFESHKIDGKALLSINEDDLRKHPLKLNCLGEIKKLYMSISQLQTINVAFYKNTTNGYLDLNNISYIQLKEQLKIELQNESNHKRPHHYHSREDRETDISSVADELSEFDEENEFNIRKLLPNGKYQEFKPEAWKALVAMLYFFFVTLITAITMVIVHDRVPDMTKYPPLPDIFLDNVPLIPFAFVMCELCGLILFLMSILLLVFHKHRFILIRRMFSLFGSVFLLRCVTMLITSLSVPGRHLNCKARPYGDWMDKLNQAFIIWRGGGMSIQGVRTCGDYMFSGHTVTLTLLNFFLTEYTPQSLYFVHTLSWVLNLFGIFFILAGHEHYSIDVFVAFYISTRLFLYYHTLANNRCLYMGDRRRTRIWFPLFYFFESGVNGIVPNEFEVPFKSLLLRLKCSPNRSPNRSPNSSLLNGLDGPLNGQLNGSSNQTLNQSRESSSSNLLKECKPNGIKPNNSNSANCSNLNEPSNSSLSKTSTRGSGKRKNKKNK